MENTSLPSSTDGLDNFLDEVVKAPEVNQTGLDDFVDNLAQEEFGRTAAAARWAKKYDPQTYAEAAKLMPEAPEVGIRQLELLRNNEALGNFQKVFEDSPQLRGFFAERPKDLAYAKPDELDNISGLQWLGQATWESMQAGYSSVKAAAAQNRIREGSPLPGDAETVAAYSTSADRTFGAHGWFDQGLVMAAQQVAPMAGTAANTVRRGVEGSILFGAAGSVIPGAGSAAGAAFGGSAGAIAGAWEFQQKYQTGLASIYFSKLKDENGQHLEPELQNLAALVTGTGGALLESASISQFIKTVPGGDRLLSIFTTKGMAEAVKNPTIRVALSNFAKNVSVSTATEITTEMLQQTLQITAEAVAKANSDGNFEQKTLGEVSDEVWNAGVQAAQVMSILGPLAAGTKFGGDIRSIAKSRTELGDLEKVTGHLENNELIARNPALASELIDKQLGDKKLYVPAQEALELYQSEGKDLYGPAIPNWRNRVDEALRTGGDIEVSIGEYVSFLGRNPKENPLATLVRTSPEAYNKAEIAPYEDALNEIISSEISKATQENPEAASARMPAKPIEVFPELETLKEQLKSVGFAPKAVDAYSTMLGGFFNTMAARTGKSASEFFNEFALSINRGDLRNANESPPSLIDDKRGSITFNTTGGADINIFDKADLSTVLHESGHFFLDTMSKVKDVTPELNTDWETIAKALGNKGEPLTVDQHEQFAKMAEAYFMEGKAPTPELSNAFQAFARWLKTLYRRITQLGGAVSPEVRGVFDRMLATEQRIEELATDTAYAPLFDSAEAMGVSPEEYIAYQKLVEDLREEATVKSRERIIGQRERLAKGWREAIQKELRIEAENVLKKQAPYTHMETLKVGKISIDEESFSKKYSKDVKEKFPAKAFKKRDGAEIEVVAELLGYPSADNMVYDFVQAEPIKVASARMAEEEMAKRYGDDFNNSEIMNLAIKQQMAQDGRLILLGKELQALKRKNGRDGDPNDLGPKQLAVQIARNSVYAKKVGELNETQVNASLRRSAAMAEAAMVKGDWAKAADWKRKQLLAQAIANEVAKTNRTVSKIRDKAAKYTKTSPKGIDPAFMEQIRALVEQYEFSKVSGKKLARRQSLREFLDEAKDDGQVVVDIPDRLLRDVGRINYKELSVEDLLGLGDTLDNLEHLGRMKNKLKLAKQSREFNEAKQELINSISQTPKRKNKKSDNYTQKEKGLARFAMDVHGSLLKPEQIIEWLDMGDIKGPAMEYIFQPIVEAQNEQNKLLLEYNDRLKKALDGIEPGYLNEPINVQELGKKLTREEIYAMALNSGSESNRKKLLEGELLTEPELNAILTHMGKEDWDRVQKIWNTLDSLWERISAMEKRLTGVAPPKVEARQIINEHGTYAGGYYPVVYDFKTRRGKNLIEDTTPSDQILASQLFDNQYILPGTSHKHTVKRTKVAKPIKLELSVLPGHVHSVVHDLAYREAVRGGRKLIWDPDVKKAIVDTQGEHVYNQMQHWLRAVATERSVQNDWLDTLIRRVRVGTTMFGMGFRVTTALAQPLGFFNSLVRVGGKNLGPAIYQMTRHPFKTLDLVNGLSGEMRDRFNTQDRDVYDSVRSLNPSKLDKVREFAFYFIGAMDKYVATATWLGAYNESMQKVGDNEAAIMHADRTVRLTQGTGHVKDMAAVMNSAEKYKMFTMFYSFFSAQYNAQVDLTRKTVGDIKAGDTGSIFRERIPQWAYLVVFPAIFGALATGNGPDKDEPAAKWALRKTLMYPIASIPLVRDLVGPLDSGFRYQFSPATRAFDKTAQALAALFSTKDQTFGERATKVLEPATTAASIAFKLPTGQAINTIEALWKGLENGDFEAKDLILGRRDK